MEVARGVPRASGREDLVADARFQGMLQRGIHAAALVAILDEVFASHGSDEWIRRLDAGGAPEFGQHTEQILVDELGYTWDDVARPRKSEVI